MRLSRPKTVLALLRQTNSDASKVATKDDFSQVLSQVQEIRELAAERYRNGTL